MELSLAHFIIILHVAAMPPRLRGSNLTRPCRQVVDVVVCCLEQNGRVVSHMYACLRVRCSAFVHVRCSRVCCACSSAQIRPHVFACLCMCTFMCVRECARMHAYESVHGRDPTPSHTRTHTHNHNHNHNHTSASTSGERHHMSTEHPRPRPHLHLHPHPHPRPHTHTHPPCCMPWPGCTPMRE